MVRVRTASVAFPILVLLLALGAPPASARAGSLDPSFGDGGQVMTSFGQPATATDVAVGPNGRIVAVGYTDKDFAVAAYHPDGSLDRSFGSDGRVTTDFGASDGAYAVAISSGRVVVAGATGVERFQGLFQGDFAVARYLSDGRLDPTFGHGGKVTIDFGTTHETAYDVVVQKDGKIVVAGTDVIDMVLARLTRDGQLDPTFGKGGKVRTSFDGDAAQAFSMALEPSGKIVVFGERVGQCGQGGCDVEMAFARYRSDGELDWTFSHDGRAVFFTQNNAGFDQHDVAIQPSGRIIGVEREFMIGVKPNGHIDRTFGTNGVARLTFSKKIEADFVSIAIAPHGKIVLAGSTLFEVARYKPGGAVDPSFGHDGRMVTRFPTRFCAGQAVALDAEGRIVVAGVAFKDKGSDFALARYLSA